MSNPLKENERAIVALNGSLEHRGTLHAALIENLSHSGVLLKCAARLSPKHRVRVQFNLCPGVVCGPVEAECVWSQKGRVGLRFRKLGALDKRLLEKLVHYHRL